MVDGNSIDRLVAGNIVHRHEIEDDGLTYRGQLAGCPVYGYEDQNYILRNLDYQLPEYYMLWMRYSEDN